MPFDGVTYEPEHDYQRLNTQMGRVFRLMSDGHWLTLREIAETVGGSEAGVSARLRDLRKEKWGGYTVQRNRRRISGVWEYRLILPVDEHLFI